MRLSKNENILACHTSFIHHTNLWLVMQLMDRGSSLHCLENARVLYNPLNNVGESKLKEINMEEHISYILHETLLGLKYIHDNGQIHRDVKAGNILLDSNANVRIADFGVSGWLVNAGSQREHTRTFVGTPCWMAPEVMEQIHGYDTKADIWSLGITALELAKGHAPYAKYAPMKVLLLTIQEDPPSLETYVNDADDDGLLEEKWTKSFQSMIEWCLQKDPQKRPNCEELLNHEHFRPFKDDAVREAYMAKMKEEICDLIPNVGDEVDGIDQLDSGSIDLPVFITTGSQDAPKGTTWIFSDGSQVATSASASASSLKVGGSTSEDFFDQFERTTQGEDFKHPSTYIAEEPVMDKFQDGFGVEEGGQGLEDEGDKDDLNAFMDQFEKETSGENFRREQQL